MSSILVAEIANIKQHASLAEVITHTGDNYFPSSVKYIVESFLSSVQRPFTANKNTHIAIFLFMMSSNLVAETVNIKQHAIIATYL
jgi:hypothetical protein